MDIKNECKTKKVQFVLQNINVFNIPIYSFFIFGEKYE